MWNLFKQYLYFVEENSLQDREKFKMAYIWSQ